MLFYHYTHNQLWRRFTIIWLYKMKRFWLIYHVFHVHIFPCTAVQAEVLAYLWRNGIQIWLAYESRLSLVLPMPWFTCTIGLLWNHKCSIVELKGKQLHQYNMYTCSIFLCFVLFLLLSWANSCQFKNIKNLFWCSIDQFH